MRDIVVVGDLAPRGVPLSNVVVDGQVGVDQARQVFANLTAILADTGASWADVAKVTIFLAVQDPGNDAGAQHALDGARR